MRSTAISVSWIFVFVLAVLAGPALGEAPAPWGQRPIAFEENRGQTDPAAKYLVRGSGYTLFLTQAEAVLALRGSGSLRMRWAGALPSPRINAEERLPGVTHFRTGDDLSRWRTGIPSWSRVRYQEVWPGIDLVFYGNPLQLENDVVVAAGADPGRARFAFDADELRIDAAGELVARVGGEEVRWQRPVSFQEVDGVRRPVESAWRLLPGGREAGFQVGAYDPARSLVIDPVLVYSTTLGASGGDMAHGIAVDGAGNAYVAGETSGTGFPGAAQPSQSFDGFLSKLAPDGSLVFTVILGGSGVDAATDVAVDGAGVIHVVGVSQSPDFPQVQPLPPAFQGEFLAGFLVRLDPSGSILSSTRLGGNGYDEVGEIALDSAGAIYLTGSTNSTSFPVAGGFQTSFGGGLGDAFAAKLAPGAGSVVWSTYLGGPGWEGGRGIAVDPAGYVVVAGYTRGPGFPTPPGGASVGSQPSGPDVLHAFVTRLNPSGSAIVYTALPGGKAGRSGIAHTEAGSVAVDAAGNAYASGYTWSPEFPVLGGLNETLNGDLDAFAIKLSPAGSLIWSALLGGMQGESANAIALDPAGNVILAGGTDSTDFPLVDPLQTTCLPQFGSGPALSCFSDVFVARLSPDASEILFSTYWGGTLEVPNSGPADEAWAVAAGPHGIYVAGAARSLDFPVLSPVQPAYGGGLGDGFVFRIAPEEVNAPPDCSAARASLAVLWPPNGKMVPVSVRGVTDPDGDPVTVRVTSVRQDEPLSGKGANASGIGTATVRLRADRAGGGDGRVYHLSFTAEDPLGASCTGEATVCVPHDAARRACGDGGPLFPSH
jgi:hypothetical protein